MDSNDAKRIRIGGNGPINTVADILELLRGLIDLQRTRVELAAAKEAAEGILNRDLSMELKRLNSMVATYFALLQSPLAKEQPAPEEGTGVLGEIMKNLSDGRRRRGGRPPME